jgi:threonine dehydrogenase-like Zn-dependent dehydrogenase
MRKIVLQEPERFIDLEAAPPVAGLGEALVRIHRVGICGTDFHAFVGAHAFVTYPRVLGHELAGEVLQVGSNDYGLGPGDRCAIEPYLSCGRCRACQLLRPNCCEDLKVFGIHLDGGMQGLLAIPISLLHSSAKLSLDQLALIEPLSVGAHAVQRSGLKRGENALVIGAGPIGLAVMQFARAQGANVHAVERNESRHDFVRRFGIDISSEPGDRLADVVFDATGDAAAMADSLKYASTAGRVVFVGITKEPVRIDDPLLHRREMTLYASRNSCHQFPRIIQMIEQDTIDAEPWITDRLGLADVPHRFPKLRTQPGTMKAMIEVVESDLN